MMAATSDPRKELKLVGKLVVTMAARTAGSRALNLAELMVNNLEPS